MKISACMIVKNESKNIRKCIESYKDIVNEIIVIDTGSTDDTVEITQSLGAKVYHEEWKDDFAQAKNVALDKASGDWIIFLDADEYLSNGCVFNLKKHIKRVHNNKKVEALSCKIFNINDGDENKIKDISKILRVFRNDEDIKFVGRIHETVKKDGRYLNTYEMKDVKIYHTGYSGEIIDSKIKRNYELLKEETKKDNVDPLIFYYLVESCVLQELFQNAFKYCELFFKEDTHMGLIKTTPLVFRIFKYKSIAMTKLNLSFEDALMTIRQGIKVLPFHPELKNEEARVLQLYGKYDEAIAAYQKALKLQKAYNEFYSNSYDIEMHQTYYSMAQIELLKNNTAEAFDYFVESLKKNKYNIDAFYGLMDVIKNQNDAEIIQFLAMLYDFKNFKDIEFLSIYLAKRKIETPFLYFFLKKWTQGYEDYGTLMSIAYLLNGNMQKAIDTAYSCYKEGSDEGALYTAIYLIFENDEKWLKDNKHKFQSDYNDILQHYFDQEQKQEITEKIKNSYITLLSELITFPDTKYFVNFVEQTQYYAQEVLEEVGDLLAQNQYYDEAIRYYKKTVDLNTNKRDEMYFKIAFAYYKLKNFYDSVEYYELGYKANDYKNNNYEPVSVLEYIIHQADDKNVIEKADKLVRVIRN